MNLRNEEQKENTRYDNLKQNYSEVIDYVSKDQNWKAAIIYIAKNNPEVIVDYLAKKDIVELDENGLSEQFKTHLYKLAYINKQKISAIKELRNATSMGLKEAKEYIDNMAPNNYPKNDYPDYSAVPF